MAYGFICRNCGYQEAVHKKRDEVEYMRGYHFSLQNCPGFEYRKKDTREAIEIYRSEECRPLPPFPHYMIAIAESLDAQDPDRVRKKEEELEFLHRQGQARSAWGIFAAIVRQGIEKTEQGDFTRALHNAPSTKEREKLIKMREEKLRGRRAVLCIG